MGKADEEEVVQKVIQALLFKQEVKTGEGNKKPEENTQNFTGKMLVDFCLTAQKLVGFEAAVFFYVLGHPVGIGNPITESVADIAGKVKIAACSVNTVLKNFEHMGILTIKSGYRHREIRICESWFENYMKYIGRRDEAILGVRYNGIISHMVS